MSNSPKAGRHWLVVAIIVLGFGAIVFLTVFLMPGQILAQTAGATGSAPAGGPTGPPPPEPIRAPAQEANPEQVGPTAAQLAATNDLEATRFRPKIRIQKGQPVPMAANAEKQASEAAARQKLASDGVFGPQEPYQAVDIDSVLSPLGWNPLLYEDFEGLFPCDAQNNCWLLWDNNIDDGREIYWGDTSYKSQFDSWSIWAAAGGADGLNPFTEWYTDSLDSWIERKFDFSGLSDVFVSYGLWYDTEPEWDWMYFCISTDFVNYSCDYWSGYSDGWTDQSSWLTTYAGYDEVWLAWVFQSDESESLGYEGPFVDEVYVWGYTPEASTPPPTAGSQLIQDGSFENGGDMPASWKSSSTGQLAPIPNAPASDNSLLGVEVTPDSSVDGDYAAYLSRAGGDGQDILYQIVTIPADADDIVLDFWQAITTFETEPESDYFCASLMSPSGGVIDVSTAPILVDLGCTDAVDALGSWQQVVYTLDNDELNVVRGQEVALVFELYNGGAANSGSAGWLDAVNVFAIGGSSGSSSDANEPNDAYTEATPLNCGELISGTIGEAAGSFDLDWFVLNNVPTGVMEIDITADTQVPPSELDSVVRLYDNGRNQVAWNDDDGSSYDSYITYTNNTAGATYYVNVESYSGSGSLNSFYDLDVQCNVTSGATGGGGSATLGSSSPISWTVMLYLNAEDSSFESTLTQYRTDIEKFVGGKSSFLKVLILYDGPGDGDTVRYEVQPNGVYATTGTGINQWARGELNMGHPDTLANFVTWAMDQYPAEHYYLAIDDHGDGAYGISIDPTSSNDLLTAPDVYAALKSATQNGARKIDIFDYEACLMGLAENAYDVREWVDYVVFFEQISWGLDTYPEYFRDLAANHTPLTVGQRIIERYHAQANTANSGRGLPHTISLIDTSQMAAVQQATSSLAQALINSGSSASTIHGHRNNSQAFANDADATNPLRADYIDLWDLADNLGGVAASQANAVKQAVEAAVVVQRNATGRVSGFTWDHRGAHGLSIYYPVSKQSNAFDRYDTNYQMSLNGEWDAFLKWVFREDTNRRGMFAARAEDKLLGGGADTYITKFVYLPLAVKD